MSITLSRKSLICGSVATALLAACTLAPTQPAGAESMGLTKLQSATESASPAPLAITEDDFANRRAATAPAEANEQKRELEEARDANAEARRNARELQTQLDELQAEVTDRGLVLTLGDVLFGSDAAELSTGGNDRLGKLAGFLDKYPDRNALIEGYADSMGSDRYNQALSERRADAVKTYLVRQGIASKRLTASGNGERSPVGDNSSANGRQQNRRVEVTIEDRLISSR